MYNFFIPVSNVNHDEVIIDGKDFNHIKNVLRMKEGERFIISANGQSHLCELTGYENEKAVGKILQLNYQDTSLPIQIVLFQGLPKSDKLELIIQKAVELGVDKIVPVQMKRSIAKIEPKKVSSKTQRFNLIAESAAKQSKRMSIPEVTDPMDFEQALKLSSELDLLIVPYENEQGMISTQKTLELIQKNMKVGIMIGPEGGFDQTEIDKALKNGAKTISLGKRILRTETASITALAMLMLHAELNL